MSEATAVISDKEIKNLLVCNEAETIGMVLSPTYVTLYRRELFEEDTVRGHGDRVVAYSAGEYSPWALAEKPYPANWEQALGLVTEWIAMENLAEAKQLMDLKAALGLAKTDVVNALKESFVKYIALTQK